MTLFFLLHVSREATHTNFIVFGLTRSGFEPTIYRTRGEHANHYTIDMVDFVDSISKFYYIIINYILVINNHLSELRVLLDMLSPL